MTADQILVFSILGGALILFAWGRWWFGAPSGWLAAVFWTLSPNVLSHSGMISTDPAAATGEPRSLRLPLLMARWHPLRRRR